MCNSKAVISGGRKLPQTFSSCLYENAANRDQYLLFRLYHQVTSCPVTHFLLLAPTVRNLPGLGDVQLFRCSSCVVLLVYLKCIMVQLLFEEVYTMHQCLLQSMGACMAAALLLHYVIALLTMLSLVGLRHDSFVSVHEQHVLTTSQVDPGDCPLVGSTVLLQLGSIQLATAQVSWLISLQHEKAAVCTIVSCVDSLQVRQHNAAPARQKKYQHKVLGHHQCMLNSVFNEQDRQIRTQLHDNGVQVGHISFDNFCTAQQSTAVHVTHADSWATRPRVSHLVYL